MATRSPLPTQPPAAWAALLDASTDLLALLDAAGTIVWANAACQRAAGVDAEALLGQTLAQALAGAAGTQPGWAQVAQALHSGQPLQLAELPWQPAPGQAGTASARLQPLAEGEHPDGARWLFSLQDRSELSHHQQQRHEAEQRLARAQEFGRLALFERELPIGRGHWDAYMFRLWGFDPALGAPSFDDLVRRIHPDDRPGLDYRDSARQPGKYAKRYRIRAPGGGPWRHVHAQWEVLAGPDGQPRQISGAMVDDTEVYELAESFNKASAQLNLAAELGRIVIWHHDLATDRVFYNNQATEVMGIVPRPEGLPLDEVRHRIHPDDLQRVKDSADESLRTDRPVDVEARYRQNDGSYRHMLIRRVVRRNAAGEAVAVVGVGLDLSEQLAEAHRAQELARRLEVTAAAAGLGIWSRGPERARAEWNAQMFALMDRTPTLGVPSRHEWLQHCVHPDDRLHMQRAQDELRATVDLTVEHQFRICRPDGSIRWLVSRARHERRDSGSVLFGITMDVTERVQTEAALRQANERIALVARGVGIGTWEHDVEHDTAFWDEQMYRLRGLSPDCGLHPDHLRFALAHPEDLPRVQRLNEEAARERRVCAYEFRVRLPDGSWRWLASRSMPVVDDSGRMLRQIGVNWDVHERVTAEAERQEKLLARRESQAKSDFLARMSHELRTPLNAVLGFAQLLQLDPALGQPRVQEPLRHIRAAGEHLLSLINDVLDLSGLETGQLRLDLQPVPLAEVLQESMALLAPAAQRAGVTLQAEPGSAVLRADRTRLRQVLINLLSNAVKYNRPQGRVEVSARQDDAEVLLTVTDTGRGMAPAQLNHLFEPFNRLGMEREGIEGAGIGLAVVKALVERMGGTVRVHSQLGQGSRFELRLPAASGPAPATPLPAPAPLAVAPALPELPATRAGRLLYIEDNPVNVLLIEALVQRHTRLQIDSVASGLEGVARALAQPPDLILVDLQLPDVHGFEVLRRLREQPATAAIPCIALSANAMPADISSARDAGFDDYWTKPIDVATFLGTLRHWLPA